MAPEVSLPGRGKRTSSDLLSNAFSSAGVEILIDAVEALVDVASADSHTLTLAGRAGIVAAKINRKRQARKLD
jgi:hypothetical protein